MAIAYDVAKIREILRGGYGNNLRYATDEKWDGVLNGIKKYRALDFVNETDQQFVTRFLYPSALKDLSFDRANSVVQMLICDNICFSRSIAVLLSLEYVCEIFQAAKYEIDNRIIKLLTNEHHIASLSKLTFNISQYEFDDFIAIRRNINIDVAICILETTEGIKLKQCHAATFACYGTIDHFKYVVMRGLNIDIECLHSACVSNIDRKAKLRLIMSSGIKPDTKSFDMLIDHDKCDAWRKAKPRMLSEIDLLVEFGYQLTYADVLKALRKKILINDVEKYKFEFGDDYLEVCKTIGHYPYNMSNAKAPDVECLRRECEMDGNLQNVRNLCEKYKLVPNTRCLYAACTSKANYNTLKFLIDKGAKPDLSCLRKMALQFPSNRTLVLLIDTLIENNNKPDNKDADQKKPKRVKTVRCRRKKDKEHIADSASEDIDEVPINNDEQKKNITESDSEDVGEVQLSKDEPKEIVDEKPTEMIKIDDVQEIIEEMPKEILTISVIPSDFDCTKSVIKYISPALKALLLKKHTKFVDYVGFKEHLLNYLQSIGSIDDASIKLCEPYLYKNADAITLSDINEWAYSLLDMTLDDDTKTVSTKRKKVQ